MTRALTAARSVAQRLGHGIAHPEQELDRLQRLVVYAYDLARHGGRQLVRDNAPLMAAALAYRTLFSAVPVLVLALVMARSFYGEEGIRRAFSRVMEFTGINELNFVSNATAAAGKAAEASGTGEVAPPTTAETQFVISQIVEQWVNNAVTRMTSLNYGAITAISVLVFIYAALILLVQVEESFNTICQAAKGRRWMTRLTNYWTLLTLGSVGVGATVALGRVWDDFATGVPSWGAWITGPVGTLGKIGVVWLLLLFAYLRMPNTRVRLKPAAVGALVAAVLWEVGKGTLVWFIRKSAGGQLEVYGPLALIPILLFWLYCTWYIVLFGLEVAWAIQTVGEARLREKSEAKQRAITAVDPSAGVALMQHLAAAFAAGKSMRSDQLSHASRMPEALVQALAGKLVEAGLVHRVVNGGAGDDESYVLARPPGAIALEEIVASGMKLTPAASGPEGAGVDEVRAGMLEGVRGRMLG